MMQLTGNGASVMKFINKTWYQFFPFAIF